MDQNSFAQFGSYILNHVINGQHVRSASDLKNVNQNDIWNYLNQLARENEFLTHQMGNLSKTLSDTQIELDVMKKQQCDYQTLYSEMERLRNENERFNQELASLKKVQENTLKVQQDSVNELHEIKSTLVASEIGIRAETKIINYIFPKCSRKPYRIRSFSNLCRFLEDPNNATKQDLCDENAPDEWNKLDEEFRASVKCRLKAVVEKAPQLKGAIKDLKDMWESAHPKCNDYNGILSYFENDPDIVDAFKICRPFYEQEIGSFLNPNNKNSELDNTIR